MIVSETDSHRPHRVVLYGKPGCHLCEDALAVLKSVRTEIDFDLVERSILDDDALRTEMAESIPVIEIDDSYFCKYRVDPTRLKQRLQEV